MKNNVYIIGAGKVGSAFAFELKNKGFEIRFMTGRYNDDLRSIASAVNAVSFSGEIEREFILGSDIIIICVQDRYLSRVIHKIGSLNADLSGKCFMHTSGSDSSDVFPAEMFERNNLVSLHPIQTFDKLSLKNNRLLEDIYFGIEGGEEGKKTARHMIESLNSKYIEIPKEKKYLYHSACVIASNFMITLLNISSEIIGSIGIDKNKTFEIFKPIIEKTLKNISEHGLVDSLTGPFERNDLETISNHLSSINKELPSLLPFYTLLGMETVKVAFKKESLNLKNVISILDLMNEYIVKEANVENKRIN